jgi:hypothetical protein
LGTSRIVEAVEKQSLERSEQALRVPRELAAGRVAHPHRRLVLLS